MNERVGTAHRTEVHDLLGRALEEGYLDLAEYEERAARAFAAKTVGELVSQVSDLPPQFQWDPRQPTRPTVPTSTPRPAVAPTPRNAHAMSVASLVLAICSVLFAICFGVGGLFGIAAIVLSIPGLRSPGDYGKALTGLVIGSVGTLLSVAVLVLFIFVPTTP